MKLRVVLLCLVVCLSLSVVAFAHPGKTDSSGGHYNHSTGQYHYHHGYSAHQHSDLDGDGDLDCPYNFVAQTDPPKETQYGVFVELEKLEQKEESFWEKVEQYKSELEETEPPTFATTDSEERDKTAGKIKDFFIPIIGSFALFGVVLLVDELKRRFKK